MISPSLSQNAMVFFFLRWPPAARKKNRGPSVRFSSVLTGRRTKCCASLKCSEVRSSHDLAGKIGLDGTNSLTNYYFCNLKDTNVGLFTKMLGKEKQGFGGDYIPSECDDPKSLKVVQSS